MDSITAYDAILEEDANLTSMPSPRSRFAIATNNATIYVIGGYASAADQANSIPQGCLLAYDVAADQWTQGACMASARADACAATVQGKIYVAGEMRSILFWLELNVSLLFVDLLACSFLSHGHSCLV